MALSLREALQAYDEPHNVVGIPLRRSTSTALQTPATALLAENAQLKEMVSMQKAHIDTLHRIAKAWRSQAENESKQRRADASLHYVHEHDLVRVIHQQMIELERRPLPKRHWWRREN